MSSYYNRDRIAEWNNAKLFRRYIQVVIEPLGDLDETVAIAKEINRRFPLDSPIRLCPFRVKVLYV